MTGTAQIIHKISTTTYIILTAAHNFITFDVKSMRSKEDFNKIEI